MQKSKDRQQWEFSHSFYHLCPRDWAQIFRFGGKHLNLLGHFASPPLICFVCCFETEAHLLCNPVWSQPPKCWDYKCVATFGYGYGEFIIIIIITWLSGLNSDFQTCAAKCLYPLSHLTGPTLKYLTSTWQGHWVREQKPEQSEWPWIYNTKNCVVWFFINLTQLRSSRKRESQPRNCFHHQIGLKACLWGIFLINDLHELFQLCQVPFLAR